MNPPVNECKIYRAVFNEELQDNILAYWMRYGVETNGDGFYPAVDLNGDPVLTANKTSAL